MPGRWRGPLVIAALALLWGSNFAWIKVSLGAFTPTQLTFGRVLLGALVLCAVVAVRRERVPRAAGIWVHLAVAALVANALPYLLFALAETRVDSSIAGIINATTPLWTLALVTALRHGETITGRRVAGFVLGLLGCAVLLAPWNAHGIYLIGALACLTAAICYAVSCVYLARYLAPRALTPTALSAAQLLIATVWTLLALAPNPGRMPTAQLGPLLALAVLGILGTGAAYVINYALIRTQGPAGASVVIYLIPVVSVMLGVTMLAEPFTPNLITGTALIITGVALTQPATREVKG
jgi:drug/metabolite transporter (DMT)-like permease